MGPFFRGTATPSAPGWGSPSAMVVPSRMACRTYRCVLQVRRLPWKHHLTQPRKEVGNSGLLEYPRVSPSHRQPAPRRCVVPDQVGWPGRHALVHLQLSLDRIVDESDNNPDICFGYVAGSQKLIYQIFPEKEQPFGISAPPCSNYPRARCRPCYSNNTSVAHPYQLRSL